VGFGGSDRGSDKGWTLLGLVGTPLHEMMNAPWRIMFSGKLSRNRVEIAHKFSIGNVAAGGLHGNSKKCTELTTMQTFGAQTAGCHLRIHPLLHPLS